MNKTDRMFEVYSPTTGQVFGFFVGPAVEDVLEDAILTIDPVDLVDITLDAIPVENEREE